MDTYAIGDLRVHRIGFGAMQLPGRGVMGPPRDRDEALAVLRRAVDLGVDHIDTAQYYGPDVSNELIHAALHPYPDGLVLVTKVGSLRDADGAWLPAQRPEQLRDAVEENLRSLGVERLGAVNLRLMDHPVGDPGQRVPMEDQLAELAALRAEGKLAGIGISTASREQVEAADDLVGIVCVQNAFSLLDRSDADVLELCHRRGIAYVPYFPLGSAFPHTPKVTEDATVRAVAARRGVTPAQLGLAWLLAHRENILLIPGTSRVSHLEENLHAADIELTAAEEAELAAAGTIAQ
ncbi:aldo/keto reductase [Propionicimonas sp.]|uniref:aldo/keto reductase n=1 Tax=Propionicimonas sp. TaxID=1955623 RepID=UPI0039E4D5B2